MAKEYRLEDDLLKKSRPGWKSKRYARLRDALYANGFDHPAFARCEICKKVLLNPQSILIHQGGQCQKRISKTSTMPKNRNIKERRFLRYELIYMWRNEISRWIRNETSYHTTAEIDQWITDVVKPAIPYSSNTNNCDVWIITRREYLRMEELSIIKW